MTADFQGLGIAVGHATDVEGATGLTIVRGVHAPLRAGAAVFGRAAGTRELHTLSVDHLVDRIDAIMLTGGSAYGLDAAAGVMRWMEERGRGFAVPGGVVPIVPAAVIFDLFPLGRFAARPTPAMAYEACDRATPNDIAEGSVGAGSGATVGKIAGPTRAMKGGVGAALSRNGEWQVGALAVVNALGDVRDAKGRIIAGARVSDDASSRKFIDTAQQLTTASAMRPALAATDGGGVPTNTTLCIVATDAPLGKVELGQLARASGAALFRRITPTGTSVDGDVVFALAPARRPEPLGALMGIEALAVAALESAIERAVTTARGRDGVPGLAD